MRLRAVAASAAFLAAFVLNPAYIAGCVTGDGDPEFSYGAKEMTALARAANDSFEFSDGTAHYRLDLAVTPDAKQPSASAQPGAFARRAYACGDRKLYATAAACGDSSSMDIRGSFTLFRIDGGSDEPVLSDVAVSGALFVPGLKLTGGQMELTFPSGSLLSGGLVLESHDGKSFELHSFTSQPVRWTQGF